MPVSSRPPLSVVNRYIAGQFLAFFVPILAGFVLLYVIIDLFDRLDIFLRYQASADAAARYFLFKIPLMVTQITPPAVITAALLAFGMLGRRNEIIALRAGGISLLQTAPPHPGLGGGDQCRQPGLERDGGALLLAQVPIRQQRRDPQAASPRS